MIQDESTEFKRDIEDQLKSLGKTLGGRVSLSQRVLDDLEVQSSVQALESAPRVTSSPRKMTMFQKISVAGLAASVTLAATLWFALSAGSVSLAQVIEKVRAATNYQADYRFDNMKSGSEVKPPVVGKYYWRAPGDLRMENLVEGDVDIYFRDKEGIEIDPKTETYRVASARAGFVSPIMLLQELSGRKEDAKRQLGEKRINGTQCEGFEFELSKVDPSAGDGTLTVWINRKTQLPVSITMEVQHQEPIRLMLDNIVWNSELSDTLFSTEPPKGYELKESSKLSQRTDAETFQVITYALKKFASLNNGKYPQVKMIYGDVTQTKMLELGGYAGVIYGKRTRDNEFREIMDAHFGWGAMAQIMFENATAEYHGLEVGPGDSDKILFRWTDKNRVTHVIYSDLRTASIPE